MLARKFSEVEFYFHEPRLEMSQPGRLLVRLIFYSSYIILAALDIIFLLSDVAALFWGGVLLFLFLLDRLIHLNGAERSFHHRPSKKANLASYLTPASFRAIEYAFERALWSGGNFYLFLIKHLADKKEIQTGLIRMDIAPEEFEQKIEEYLEASLRSREYAGSKKEIRRQLIQEIEKLVQLAFKQAIAAGDRFITPANLFTSLSYIPSEKISKLFGLFDIDPGDLQLALIFGRRRIFWRLRKIPATLGGFVQRTYFVRHRIMNRAWSARPTPILDKFSEDLTDYARLEKVGFLVGHEGEYDRMIDVLSRPGKPNVLLVGEPGVGKETLVAHLAFRIVKDDVPAELFDKRLVRLDIGSLIAGVDQGELQQRIRAIIGEIARAGNIILFIPDIHQLAKTSGKASLSAADILLPAIRGTDFSVIGTTYPREFKESIENQTDFSKAFEVIRVEEVSPAEAMKILIYQSIILEKLYRMKISFGAIKQAVTLAHKYFRNRLLPGSAEDLLKEAISDAKGREDKYLTAEDVLDIAQRQVNIPLRQAEESEAEQLLNLEKLIHQRLIDQEEAVKAVARAMREYRSGLSRKGGPIASFLFVGPTGVGKTELSKILAGIQFGSKEAMVRFDMSEYQDKQSIFRFIGSPDQSVSGVLTDAILQKPYSLILLDEFEKAHPDILNLFLQVFDDGRLTDNLGRVVDFQNTMIIATSNAHSEFIKTEIEKGRPMQEISEDLKKRLTAYFKPELINRFSGIIVFKNLSPEDILAIAKIQLNDLASDLKENQGIELQLNEEALAKIAEWGYDPVFGARPLRGVISEKIRSVLAEKILKGEIGRGSSIIIALEDNQLIFKD
jgi:ATP-dependent Clp protease ATP-binding subunit ClpC